MIPRESIYKRYHPSVISKADSDDYSYWFVFCSNALLINRNEHNIPYQKSVSAYGLSPVRTHYIGTLEGHPCYSVEIAPDTAAPEGMAFIGLRSLYGILDEDIYLLAGKAVQIVNWDQTHQYCGRCGHKTHTLRDEMAKKCPACGFLSYPRLSPVTITAVLRDNRILLSQNATFRGNTHSIIAGFVEPGETLEECIKREVAEEVGIQIKNINYFGSQPWPFPNSLMIGFTAEYESGEISVDGKEIISAGWYDVNNLPELPAKMSISREIIDWFIRNNSIGD